MRFSFSRAALGLCWLLGLSGCGEGFDPGSEVKTLRVLGVHKDKPYPRPGEDVTLTLLWTDGSGDARPDPVQVTWLRAGDDAAPKPACVNPEGDLYYGCFAKFGLDTGLLSGNTFKFQVPPDIVSKRPASISSSRHWRSRMPALFTSAVTGPSSEAAASNMRTTSASRATSPCTASAFTPALRASATTSSAALASER